MSNQFWVSNSNSPSQGAGSTLSNSGTNTDISPLPQWTFPYYLYVGQRVRVTAYGTFSNTGTPTLALAVYYGGAASGTLLATTGAVTTTTGATTWPWDLTYSFRVASVGSSGTIVGQGRANFPTSLTLSTAQALPSTATNPVTVNTSTLQTLTVAAQWGTPASANTITLQDFIVELMN